MLKTGLRVLIQGSLSESLAIGLLAPLIEYLNMRSFPLLLQRQELHHGGEHHQCLVMLPLSQHQGPRTLGQMFLALPLSQLDLEGNNCMENETLEMARSQKRFGW